MYEVWKAEGIDKNRALNCELLVYGDLFCWYYFIEYKNLILDKIIIIATHELAVLVIKKRLKIFMLWAIYKREISRGRLKFAWMFGICHEFVDKGLKQNKMLQNNK